MKSVWPFLLFFFTTSIFAETTFIVNTPFNTPDTDIYITGNHSKLCYWKPKCIKLTKIFEKVYKVELNLDQDVEFKITRGSWNTEAGSPSARALKNSRLIAGEENIFTIKNWVDQPPLRAVGEIHKYNQFYSPQLNNERSIHVWLPPTYRLIENKNYPVLYFHDGQNAFDPKESAFGVDWSIDDIAQQMNRKHLITEFIIVAVFSKNRNEEYNHTKLGKDYAHFLVDTVKPFIDTKYRTLANRNNTYLMGSSMGALISFSILWTYPHIFSKATALSFPAFAYDDFIFSVLENNPAPKEKVSFYMDHGTAGQDSKYSPHAKRFYDLLNKKGIYKSEYKIFPYADHTETDWARRLPVALNFLFSTQSSTGQ